MVAQEISLCIYRILQLDTLVFITSYISMYFHTTAFYLTLGLSVYPFPNFNEPALLL